MKKSLAEQYADEALQDRIWTGKCVLYAYAVGMFTGALISILCHLAIRC